MSDRISPWTLMEAERYAEAAEEYARLFAEGGGSFELRGCALALLLAGRPAEALSHYRKVIETTEPKQRSASDFVEAGICHWYLTQPAEAVISWREGLTAPYRDAAGGVVLPALLLYAATRLVDPVLESEAERLLRGHLQKHRARIRRGQAKTSEQAHEDFVHPGLYAWPGALVPFLLGEIGAEALDRAAAGARSDIMRSRHQCQADFVAAVRARREENQAAFRDRMKRCAASPYGVLEHEFLLARWEVANGFQTTPFTTGESGDSP